MDYQEFRRQYEEQHPASVPRLEQEVSIYPGWLEAVVAIMFICASMLSGVHTVPAVRGGMDVSFWGVDVINGVALGSFVAIELVFLVGAYALMRKATWYVLVTLITAFIIAMVANLQQNFKAYQAGDPGTIIVAVTFGIGAPFIAFMAGKMFVDIYKARRMISIDAKRRFDEASVKWDGEIERAWNKVQKAPVHEASRDTFMKSHEKPASPKPRVKLHEVAREVHENGDSDLSAEKMMEKYQISMGSTTKVREILKAQIASTNGHHSGDSS